MFIIRPCPGHRAEGWRQAKPTRPCGCTGPLCAATLGRAATVTGDLYTAAIALEGLSTDGTPDDAVLLLAKGTLAMHQGDLQGAEDAATQARNRVALGRPEDWQMFDLVSLQGMVAHQKGEWFQRLMLEMRAGVLDSEFGPQLIDQQLAMQRPARGQC